MDLDLDLEMETQDIFTRSIFEDVLEEREEEEQSIAASIGSSMSPQLDTQAASVDITTTETAATTATTTTSFSRFRQKRRAFGSVEKESSFDSIPTSHPPLSPTTTEDLLPPSSPEEGRQPEMEDDLASCTSGLFDNQSTDSSPFQMTFEAEKENHQAEDLPTVVETPVQVDDKTQNNMDDSSEDEMELNETEPTEIKLTTEPVDSLATLDRHSVASVTGTTHSEDENRQEESDVASDSPRDDGAQNLDGFPKETTMVDEPPQETEAAKEAESSSAAMDKEPAIAATEKKAKPDHQSLINSTDQLFLQVTDRTKVTVKDILQSLQTEYDIPKFDKESKAVVRERLTALLLGNVKPLQQGSSDDDEEGEESESENEEVSESEASVGEADGDDDSDFEVSKPSKKVARKKTPSKKTKATKQAKEKRTRIRRKSAAAVKAAAVRVQAEQLRKKRLEELRIRNEELQLMQNQEEQKRAAKIAAKLETDTEEIRLERLEQRLDLLQKLDKKRFEVIKEATAIQTEMEAGSKEEPDEKLFANEESEEEESSDEEMELELVGKPTKPLLRLQPDVLSLLSLADRGVPMPNRKKSVNVVSKATVSESSNDEFVSLLQLTKQNRKSPGQSLNARAALKKRLLSKQRRMGNQWLARELGYQSEKDHVADCLRAEHQKRLITLKQEQERIEANERKILRERWVRAEDGPAIPDEDDDPEDEDYQEPEEADDGAQVEIDDEEEMAVAMELNQINETEDPKVSSGSKASPTEAEPGMIGEISKNEGESTLPRSVDAGELTVEETQTTQSADDFRNESYIQCPKTVSNSENTENETEDTNDATDSSSSSKDIDSIAGVATEYPEAVELETQPPTVDPPEEEIGDEPEQKKGPRNSAWREMLRREAEKIKKMKNRKGEMIDDQAEEEEEEEIVGLEDFGFAMHKKKKDDDDENEGDDDLDEDDMEDVVDDVSVGEGDEDAGEEARKAMELREEQERHKEIMRRMREGYDGRRGGIAGGGAGARGVHRFDQLVAADNREDAKRLGLLNDDEMDSEDEQEGNKNDDEEEDEAEYLDKMLKDRFLHRSSIDIEENFSEDEDDEEEDTGNATGTTDEDMEEKEQERMAKRFTKRARMQRLIEAHGQDEEFSQLKLIEEDLTLKEDLSNIKNGLIRKRSHSQSVASSESSFIGASSSKRPKLRVSNNAPAAIGSSLAIALQASRRKPSRASFFRDTSAGSVETTASSFQRTVGFKHVIFQSSSSKAFSMGANSQSQSSLLPGTVSSGFSKSSSLWSNVSRGFQKRH